MKTTFTIVATVACALLLMASPAVHAQALKEYTTPLEQVQPAEGEKEDATPHERLKEEAAKLTEAAEERIGSFAQHADDMLKKLAEPRLKGWAIFALAGLVGAVSLLWGWRLIQSLLIPFAPVWGLTTGAVTTFCIIQAFYTGRPAWFRLTVLGVGVTLGISLYLFAALRARPVAVFLVVLSPFLIIAAFLFDYNSALGIAIFCGGFLAGFAAMIEVRPLAIVSTSMLGAAGLLGTWGLLSYLMNLNVPFVKDSFQWLIINPLMLVLGWAVVTFIGTNFQFSTGPSGGLED